MGFTEKTNYLLETKSLLKDRINSLGGSITEGTTFRDYLVWLDSLYETLDEKTITGLPDSLEGKCEQTTTQTGKNLYYMNYTDFSHTWNGLTITSTTTGYSISNTATGGGDYTLVNRYMTLPAGTYTMVLKNASSMVVGLSKNNYASILRIPIGSTSGTFTLSEETKVCLTLRVVNGTTYDETNNIMIEKGNQATPYEPYIPNSPSPDHPQPINITTGRQVVSVCGKNLFDGIFRQGSENSTTVSNYVFSSSNFQLNAGTYTFSTTLDNTYQYAIFGTTNPFPNSNTKTYNSGWKTGNTTFTISQELYVGILVRKANLSNFTPSDLSSFTFMLEKGNQPTTYEEYKGNDYEINLGKNLISISNVSRTLNGLTGTINGNTITISGTNTKTDANYGLVGTYTFLSFPNMLPGETYTLSLDGNTSGTYFQINYYKNGTTTQGGLVNQVTGTTTFTVPSDYTGVAQAFVGIYRTATTIDTTFNVQLEKGSQASSFTPYKTPIYLGKIGTYQDYIIKTSGKNLFDKDNTTTQVGYFNTTGGIENGGQSTVTTSYIPILPNTNLTISGFVVNRICYYDQNKNFLERSEVISTTPYTFNKNAYYIRIQGVTDVFDINKLQLEKGNQATLYEPYGTGQWYIHKEIGRVVLNGSESGWDYNTSTQYPVAYRKINDKISSRGGVLSNYFSFNNGGWYVSPNNTITEETNNNYIFIKSDVANTLANWKTWLSSNNVEVYYVLNTPTNTLIEDEELINQLNEIEIFTIISEDFYN